MRLDDTMSGSSFDRVVDKLERVVGPDGNIKASCPVPSHGQGRGDRNPSLHVTHDGSKTLLSCQSGCHVQDILLALGLDYPDLFDEPPRKALVASFVYQRPDGTPYHVSERWQTDTGKTFVQRLPGAKDPGLGKGFRPAIYRLPQVLAQCKAGGRVYWVEGEKSVHAAEAIGLVATCCTNGTNGWQTYFPKWLQGASEVVVVADNDEPGKTFAASVIVQLRGAGIKARCVISRTGGPKDDLYDHVTAGFGEDDLVPVNLNRLRPEGTSLAQIVSTKYSPVKWAVDGLIPAGGVTLLGGPPKIGKSYVSLSLALGVACQGTALGPLNCQGGSVLYLSLDNDSERRIQERTRYIWGGVPPEVQYPIEVHTEWPTGIAALAAAQEWAQEADEPLLVVMDTWVRVEPEYEGRRTDNSYAASVEVMSKWANFARDADVAVLAIHHAKKAGKDGPEGGGDWLERFMGSVGITATAQTLLFLDAKRGEREGVLRVSGRDVETDDLELMRMGRQWVATEAPRVPLRVVH